ncbi:MAG: ABC transporter ATP-binding protein [Rhodospirillales bacterium]
MNGLGALRPGRFNSGTGGACAMITVQDVHMHFGGVRAVDGASFTIQEGLITGLIGPNGAGKTTLFNVINGALRPAAGKILLDGEDITGLPPHDLFAKGLLRTFQIVQEFSSLSVLENLMAVPGGQSGERLFNACFTRGKIRAEEEKIRARAEDVMAFLQISHMAGEKAGNLSGGQKKLLELGRTMMTDAKIVFLDEVGAGVNRTLLASICESVVRLQKERGYTFCVIEHDMDMIAELCDPVIVMAEGKVLTQGAAGDVMCDERVIEAYLGAQFAARTDAKRPEAEA